MSRPMSRAILVGLIVAATVFVTAVLAFAAPIGGMGVRALHPYHDRQQPPYAW